MRVLIVKMSSMGDLIHTLPAVSDASDALPGIQFDWVAEEAFSEIPSWHNCVHQVVPIALRRWRKEPRRALQQHEIKRFYKQLRLQHYDTVIDAQGSIKSAVITYLSRGHRVGMDRRSVREIFAYLAYQEKYPVPRKQHAVDRLRQLFSQALHYPLPVHAPCYNIAQHRLHAVTVALPKNYLFIAPNTSGSEKCWPETSWTLLLEKTTQAGVPVVVPWGNEEEKKRVMRIRSDRQSVTVLPHLCLSEMASVVSQAQATVCVDTGLSHLAAALEKPTITLYGPTDPALIGTLGVSQIHLQAINGHTIPVDTVWQTLKQVLAI